MDSTKWPRLKYTKCKNGVAEAIPGDPLHTFRCKNVSFPEDQPKGQANTYGCRLISTTSSTTPLSAPPTPTTAVRVVAPLGAGSTPSLAASSSVGFQPLPIDCVVLIHLLVSGMYDGCAMIEILPEGRMRHLGFL